MNKVRLFVIAIAAFAAPWVADAKCQFKFSDAILCSNPRSAAFAFSAYGFDRLAISKPSNAQYLLSEGCARPKGQYKTADVLQFGKLTIATPNEFVEVVGASVNGSDYYFASSYIDGVCDRFVPKRIIISPPSLPPRDE